MDKTAVHKVFKAKRRPLSDPLIIHVVSVQEAFKLWKIDSDDYSNHVLKALIALMEEFWPGPLTLISEADESVPSIITAETGFVAARCPSNTIAKQLISLSGVPIAAPSANRFGHVSPTRADHVLFDLGDEDVWVVDPTMSEMLDEYSSCSVGVESTVAKVEEGVVSVLRHGAVSPRDIEDCLVKAGLGDIYRVQVCVRTTGEEVHNVSHGQAIKHYSPDVPSFILSHERINKRQELSINEKDLVKTSVVVDFGGQLSWLKDSCLAYKDLSSIGNSSEAAMHVFDSLRWAELVNGVERIYFPELVVEEGNMNDALILAVKDRLTRAASGVMIDSLR